MAFSRGALISSVLLAAGCLASAAWSQQTGTSGITAAGSGTVDVADTNRTRSITDSNGQPNRRQNALLVAGSVIMDDGTRPPTGVVIERVCNGQATKVAFVGPDGGFSFKVGSGGSITSDATDLSEGRIWDPMSASSMNVSSNRNPIRLAGCELRAHMGGYRSSSLALDAYQTMGTSEVGAIVLYPALRIKGTSVSYTTLAAPKKAKKALELAEKSLRKKDLEAAERFLHAALDGYPNYAAAWYRLGQVHEMSCRMEDAQNALNKALQADHNYVAPYVELARIAYLSHKWQESADLAASALRLNPLEFPFAYYLDAFANFNLNRLDMAERSARMLGRLDPQHKYPENYILLASILRRYHDTAGEAEQLREYLKYAPQADDAPQIRARLQRIAGVEVS